MNTTSKMACQNSINSIIDNDSKITLFFAPSFIPKLLCGFMYGVVMQWEGTQVDGFRDVVGLVKVFVVLHVCMC